MAKMSKLRDILLSFAFLIYGFPIKSMSMSQWALRGPLSTTLPINARCPDVSTSKSLFLLIIIKMMREYTVLNCSFIQI